TAESVGDNWFGSAASQVSAHDCIDANSIVQCVPPTDRAWHCGDHGNQLGYGIEIAGYARFTPTQWQTGDTADALEIAAWRTAPRCPSLGIPPRRISWQQLQQGVPGICGHLDVHYAFPADTTHTDPGSNFPWAWFMSRVAAYYSPTSPTDGDTVAETITTD